MPLRIQALPFLPPGLIQLAVSARSQNDPAVTSVGLAQVTVAGSPGLALSLSPERGERPGRDSIPLLVTLTNPGNREATQPRRSAP
ncbi:MAG: hypothetical protein AB4911_06285 [Oscillochloridaceae bacterium umkhey_bin13]